MLSQLYSARSQITAFAYTPSPSYGGMGWKTAARVGLALIAALIIGGGAIVLTNPALGII